MDDVCHLNYIPETRILADPSVRGFSSRADIRRRIAEVVAMSQIKTMEHEAAFRRITDDELAVHLEHCLRGNDLTLFPCALGMMARAKGMTKMARETGLTRSFLYRTLSTDGDPSFSTIIKVSRVLGFRMRFEAVPVLAE